MREPIRVLVADDHHLFRRGVVGLLNEQSDFTVVGEASSGPEAVALAKRIEPDVVLMDVYMPRGSGVDAVEAIKGQVGTRVLMLTVSDRDEDLIRAIRCGADGYLLKNAEPQALYDAIRRVAAGQGVLAPEVTLKVMRAATTSARRGRYKTLSGRERQVLVRMARGSTTAEIALDLVIAVSTVKTHIRHIYKKLNASNRAEAVARASALGLLEELPEKGD